jgi:PAS domain S-box-containing protein
MVGDEYRAVFLAAPDAVLLVDASGRIREANPMAERMFGYERAELIGQEIEILLPAAARAHHVEQRSAYAAHPTARPMGIGLELSARRKDGIEIPVEIGLSPYEAEGLTIATVRDVSHRKRLRRFGAAALRASEGERMRIARELHDDTAQRLSALLLRLRLLERDAPEVARALDGFREEISYSLEDVRRIARGLRPPEIEDAGVVAALRAHTRGLRDSLGFEVSIDAEPVDDVLDPTERLVLYRVAQEALANAWRYSQQESATVSVHRLDGHVVTTIRDRGVGFTPGAYADPGAGLGLLGMQERAAAVGGRLEVESRPGNGTTVTLFLPARLSTQPQVR